MQKTAMLLLPAAILAVGSFVACKGGRVHSVKCSTRGSKVMKWGEQVVVKCPKKCNKKYGSVWGTDLYTTDSSVCRAAIHAGVIGKRGGYVRVKIKGRAEKFEGSEANGIKTSNWPSYPTTFKVSKR